MAIESASADAQFLITRRARIAARAVQRFAERSDPLTAAQAVPIDAALNALLTALQAAGVGANPLVATVSDQSNVTVKNSAGTVSKTGIASVAASAITGVALPAASAIVDNGTSPVMQNSAGTAIPGTHNRTVTAGAEANVKLAATVGVLVNGVKYALGAAFTGSGAFLTPTIANGVITGGVLSAS